MLTICLTPIYLTPTLSIHYVQPKSTMESSPPPKKKEDGEKFYSALGDLKFPPTSGGLSQRGGGKIFHSFFGGTKYKVC